jgi:hypothetical protein
MTHLWCSLRLVSAGTTFVSECKIFCFPVVRKCYSMKYHENILLKKSECYVMKTFQYKNLKHDNKK